MSNSYNAWDQQRSSASMWQRRKRNVNDTKCKRNPRSKTIRSLEGAIMADDIHVKREIILEADGETLQKMRKEGHARGFTVYCDEAERTGGENTAPPPLAYLGLALAF